MVSTPFEDIFKKPSRRPTPKTRGGQSSRKSFPGNRSRARCWYIFHASPRRLYFWWLRGVGGRCGEKGASGRPCRSRGGTKPACVCILPEIACLFIQYRLHFLRPTIPRYTSGSSSARWYLIKPTTPPESGSGVRVCASFRSHECVGVGESRRFFTGRFRVYFCVLVLKTVRIYSGFVVWKLLKIAYCRDYVLKKIKLYTGNYFCVCSNQFYF